MVGLPTCPVNRISSAPSLTVTGMDSTWAFRAPPAFTKRSKSLVTLPSTSKVNTHWPGPTIAS
jgi:hypothetical protein